ncbi:MAG: Dabb family protein [Nocardiopsaceae bacterium]|nr:Dabb family protein [Nocardiopsaceae bacterium]
MIRHVVMFNWTPEATAEQVEQVVTELGKLPARIGAIKAYAFGPDAGFAQGNFDFAVTADFDDEAGYVSYRDHPDHREIVQRLIAPIMAERSAVQFEVTGP